MINFKTVINNLSNGVYDSILKELYVDKNLLNAQKQRYVNAINKHQSLFSQDEISIFSAPGRTEICGNHTDHQHGKILAGPINLDAIAVVSLNDNYKVNLISDGFDLISVDLNDLETKEDEASTTISLIRGVANGIKKLGYKIGGFNAYVTSDVLIGSGLSSSAAFENLIGVIISGLYNQNQIDSVTIAKISKYAENEYFKKPSGLMDQMASSVGGIINVDFKDDIEPTVKKLNVDFDSFDYSICIVDTKGSHADLTDDYAMIPFEMKKVANYFNKEVLVDVDKQEFYNNLSKLREFVGDRAVLRAIHFFNEQENVESAVEALDENDVKKFLSIIKQSGNSSYKYLQNVYTVKDTVNQNLSVALAYSEAILKDNGVSRVHGGGFAGTIQAFVKNEFVLEYKALIEKVFAKNSCHVLKIRNVGSTMVI